MFSIAMLASGARPEICVQDDARGVDHRAQGEPEVFLQFVLNRVFHSGDRRLDLLGIHFPAADF